MAYAILEWISGATRANIVNDIVKFLTGETDKANLSANLNQGNSSILATVAAGWSVHDAAAGTDMQCVKAPCADDAAAYKYVLISHTTTTVLAIIGYDAWNAATHVGTGKYTGSDLAAHSQRSTPASSVVKLRIQATARHIIIQAYCNGTRYGAAATNGSGPSGVFERTRAQAWDTVAAGYIPSVWCNIGSFLASETVTTHASHATAKKYDGTSVQGYLSAATIGCCTLAGSSTTEFPASASAFVKDASGNNTIAMFPIWFINPGTFVAPLGEISSICDVWMVPRSLVADMDEFNYDSKTYTAMAADQSSAIVVRKG